MNGADEINHPDLNNLWFNAWSNWKAYQYDQVSKGLYEVRIFSDAQFIGQPDQVGPYKFIHASFRTEKSHFTDAQSAAVIRIDRRLDWQPKAHVETDDRRHSGGTLSDELAALASLILAVRMMAGPHERVFDGEDPFGRPCKMDPADVPHLLTGYRPSLIPGLRRVADLRELSRLSSFPDFSAVKASNLIKAARLYQQALWTCDAAPEIAWLLLVSAIEAVAVQDEVPPLTKLERLEKRQKSLAKELDDRGLEDIKILVANAFCGGPLIGSSHNFVRFFLRYKPEPPDHRSTISQVKYSDDELSLSLHAVYKARNDALHEGVSIPTPMCQVPDMDSGLYLEKPSALGFSSANASWGPDSVPMYLHTFAHLVRGAILNWWESEVGNTAV